MGTLCVDLRDQASVANSILYVKGHICFDGDLQCLNHIQVYVGQ